MIQNRLNKTNKFTQKALAGKFGFSVSTVFNALKDLRTAGIVKVSGSFFVLEDWGKLMYKWTSERSLGKEIYGRYRASGDVREIEGLALPDAAFGLYSGFKFLFDYVPAEYDHVYIYLKEKRLGDFLDRISTEGKELKKDDRNPNLFFLKPDDFIEGYGSMPPEQLFVDIWNAPEWYSKDFIKELKNNFDI